MKIAVLAGTNYTEAVIWFLNAMKHQPIGIDVQRVRSDDPDLIGALKSQTGIRRMSLEEIEEANPDVVFSFSYPKIIKGKLLTKRCINWHLGKLPRFRGRHPVIHAILENQAFATATFHLMAEKVDAGNILVERQTPIYWDDTSESVSRRLVSMSINALASEYDKLVDSTYTGRPPSGESRLYRAADLEEVKTSECDDPCFIWNRERALNNRIVGYNWLNNQMID